MNYIWDVLLKAAKEKLNKNNITFVNAKVSSPYLEIAFDELNTTTIKENCKIEVNPNYRFYEIFKDLFNINLTEDEEIRNFILDILMHYLAKLDLKSGLCKKELYKKFILNDMMNGVYGQKLENINKYFNDKEINCLLNGFIHLSKTGTSLYIFNKVMKEIFERSIILLSKDKENDMYIYLGVKKNSRLQNKIEIILDSFLPINMKVNLFWNKPFGIIGIKETMKIDEIIMVS